MNRTCNQCGWVHFGVTREQAVKAIADFNEFYDHQPATMQQCYASRACIEHYSCCDVCGGPHMNFRDSVPSDCPDGCTIGPIIVEVSNDDA